MIDILTENGMRQPAQFAEFGEHVAAVTALDAAVNLLQQHEIDRFRADDLSHLLHPHLIVGVGAVMDVEGHHPKVDGIAVACTTGRGAGDGRK